MRFAPPVWLAAGLALLPIGLACGGGDPGGSDLDPCAGVVCDSPPPAACEGDTQRRFFQASGSCAFGQCSYPSSVVACPAGEICLAGACAPAAALRIDVRADQPFGGLIRPVWSRLNVWDLGGAPDSKPFPFYEEGVLMTATGGRSPEMYREDASGQPVYDFSRLDRALDNLLVAGITPLVVIGNTPRDLSTRPDDQGAFDANTGSPDDPGRYLEYLRGLFAHLTERYGQERAGAVRYRLLTEPDNQGWWWDGLGAYEDLYDLTLAAMRGAGLEAGLDTGNLMTPVGPLAWTGPLAAWLAEGEVAQVLFADGFEDGSTAGWTSLGASLAEQGGELLVGNGAAVAGDPGWGPVRVTAELRTTAPGPEAWLVGWLLVHYRDPQNFYALGLHGDGWLELGRTVGGAWEGLLQVVQTGLSPADLHRFEIQSGEDAFLVSVDGRLVIQAAPLGAAAAGRVGIWAWDAPEVRVGALEVHSPGAAHSGALPRTRSRFSFSCYARGQMGMDPRELGDIVEQVRQALSATLPDALVGVDEGMILFDEDGRYLWLGDGTELGAAWNAAIAKIAHDVALDRYVQWGYDSDGVKSPTYNVLEMLQRMRGGERLSLAVSGQPAQPDAYVDALAARGQDGAVRVLAFHYDPERGRAGEEDAVVMVQGLLPAHAYAVEHLRVDRDHSNFFTRWLEDSQAAGVQLHDTGGNSGSRYDMGVTAVLSPADGGLQFWQQRRSAYLELDDLVALEGPAVVGTDAAGVLVLPITLPAESVSLLELWP